MPLSGNIREGEAAECERDPDFMLSLARGLSVSRAFEPRHTMTTSRASELAELPRRRRGVTCVPLSAQRLPACRATTWRAAW
jgi:hypothetical protein